MTRRTEGGIAAETGRIVLGERTFEVRGFTLDQMQILLDLFDGEEKKLNEGGWEVAREIILAALGDQVGKDELLALKVTLRQVTDAVRIIGLVSEIYQVGEPVAPVDQTSA